MLVLTNTNLLYIFQRATLATTGTFSGRFKYVLQRMLDINSYMANRTSNSNSITGREVATTLEIDETAGVVYIGSNAGNVYKIDCGWGAKTSASSGAMGNRMFGFRFYQLEIPVPPTPVPPTPTPVTPNSTNTTNSTTVTPQTTTSPPEAATEGLSQTVIIVISVLGGIVGVAAILLIYFFVIKPAIPSIGAAEPVTKVKTYDTKMDIN